VQILFFFRLTWLLVSNTNVSAFASKLELFIHFVLFYRTDYTDSRSMLNGCTGKCVRLSRPLVGFWTHWITAISFIHFTCENHCSLRLCIRYSKYQLFNCNWNIIRQANMNPVCNRESLTKWTRNESKKRELSDLWVWLFSNRCMDVPILGLHQRQHSCAFATSDVRRTYIICSH